MPKKSKQSSVRERNFIYILVACAAVVCILVIVFVVALRIRTADGNVPKDQPAVPRIQLGPFAYHIVGNKAVPRTDGTAQSVKTFLTKADAKSGCLSSAPDYEYVIRVTKDEKQFLFHYGCGGAYSSAYAVNRDGSWQFLSPTNHFDDLGIPECGYVNSESISSQIAPVCYTVTGDVEHYATR